MGKRIDLTGQRFGRLVVEGFAYVDKSGHSMWKCRCDCGKYTTTRGGSLKCGETRSCGCFQREKQKRIAKNNFTAHGKTNTRLFSIWRSMINRTERKDNKSFKYYGSRGIKVCDEWRKDFQKFYDWAMRHGYGEHLTIDRIDNDNGYYPDNCRWVDRKNQSNNRRCNVKIEYKGERQTLSQWSKKLGISRSTLWDRIFVGGWTVEKAFETPVGEQRKK